MKQIIVIFTLISFGIYIGGCTKSVKISVDELTTSDKYNKTDVNQIKFESATLTNDSTLNFKKKSGKLDLNLNLISGMLESGDSTFISLDTVKHLNHRKPSYVKTFILVALITTPIIAFLIGTSDIP